MEILACGFAALIASDTDNPDNPQDAEHYYGRKYARDLILGNSKISGNSEICGSGYEEMMDETNVDLMTVERD